MSTAPKRTAGPAIYAIHPWVPWYLYKRVRKQLLKDEERAVDRKDRNDSSLQER